MENKISTAEKFAYNFKDKVFYKDNPDSLGTAIDISDVIGLLKDFATLHVEAALKSAVENAKITFIENEHDLMYGGYKIIDKNSIINSYPLENIK